MKIIPVSLAIIYVLISHVNDPYVFFGISLAFFFCILGDINIDRNFITGMLFFTIAQLIFSLSYVLITLFFFTITIEIVLVVILILLVTFGYGILFIRYLDKATSGLGKYKNPLIVYMTLISFMFISSTLLWLTSNDIGYLTIVLGGIMFIISDSLIAIREFHPSFKPRAVAVMGTYYLAILFISLIPDYIHLL